jgi:threonine dehydrogenase-like Zn-dependent dehydrogenase
VLTEPLSVAEKAIDEAVRLRLSRLPDASATPRWLYGGRWLVAGLGSVGLLAAMILGLRGAEVFGLDIVDPESARPQWLSGIGGRYVDGRQVRAERVANVIGPVATVVEAAGVPSLAFSLLDALAPNGVLVLTGIPGGDRSVQVPGAHLVRAMVLKNQVLIGSVNAAPQHYQMAVDDLLLARWRWGAHLERLITHRYPPADVRRALQEPGEDEIKAVVEWA